MAGSEEFDHHEVASALDFTSFDSYPLGNLMQGSHAREEKERWMRVGAPDYQGFHCDLYRHQGRRRLWIAEQQPGPVNWADYNPAPASGAVRLWTWIAFAHGAEVVLFFRWRQARYGQEQFHSALHRADGTPDRAAREVKRVAEERVRVPATVRESADVAMIVDYPSRWAAHILPQGRNYSGADVAASWYRAVREQGVDLDVVGPRSDLSVYRLVLVPDLLIDNRECVESLLSGEASVLLGPRCGSKTTSFQTPPRPAPGSFRKLIDLEVLQVESLPPWRFEPVRYGHRSYRVSGWRERVRSDATVAARFTGPPWAGSAAILRNERATYLAMLPQGALLRQIIADVLERVGIDLHPTGADLRVTRRGEIRFAFNFGSETVSLPQRPNREYLVGGPEVGAVDLAIWRDN